MAKQILSGDEARQALLRGITKLAEPVISTLGPKGKNVGLEKWGEPKVIHDGVTVAKDIILEDPFENFGANLIKQAASKTNDLAGDGTTTATLLAKQFVLQGYRFLVAGANPMVLRTGIDQAISVAVEEVKRIAIPVKTPEEIAQIAGISAQNEEIGKLISEAIEKVGYEGVITVEEGGRELELSYTEGMEFNKGYFNPYFVTDTDKMEVELKDPYILITDKNLSSISDIQAFIEAFATLQKNNLVIISDIVDGDALKLLVFNKLKGILNVVAVKAPEVAERQRVLLEDMAVLTGGKFISEAAGDKLDGQEVDGILGRADKVIVGKDFCKIIGGRGDATEIEQRCEELRSAISKADSEFDKEGLRERLAKLAGGVAILSVGAPTETELSETKERVKDAVSATKAAIEEGIVPGGGVVLLRIRKRILEEVIPNLTGDAKFGAELVYNSLSSPMQKILQNADEKEQIIMDNIESNKEPNYGYDIMTKQYGDMYKLGVVDPAKVTRLALESAASVAGAILTTENVVVDIPEKSKE